MKKEYKIPYAEVENMETEDIMLASYDSTGDMGPLPTK